MTPVSSGRPVNDSMWSAIEWGLKRDRLGQGNRDIIYILGLPGFFKVGRTGGSADSGVFSRMSALQCGSPHLLRLYATAVGGTGIEHAIQDCLDEFRVFPGHRIAREWFKATDDSLGILRDIYTSLERHERQPPEGGLSLLDAKKVGRKYERPQMMERGSRRHVAPFDIPRFTQVMGAP